MTFQLDENLTSFTVDTIDEETVRMEIPRALITLPNVARDLLIREPSLRRSRLTGSRLARSLKKKPHRSIELAW